MFKIYIAYLYKTYILLFKMELNSLTQSFGMLSKYIEDITRKVAVTLERFKKN